MTKTSELTRNRNVHRDIYIDFIRILASFFVVYLHTGKYGVLNYTLFPVRSLVFPITLCFSVFSRVAVPLFLMISGAFLLGKDEGLGVVLKKRVWKYIKLIVVFSFINYVIDNCILEKEPFRITQFAANILSGNVPGAYWYLYVTLGLMLLLPFLRSIAQRLCYRTFRYLVLIVLLVSFVFEIADAFWLSEISTDVTRSFQNVFPSKYLLYFLVGYGIYKFVDMENRPKRDVVVIAALWAGSILAMAALTVIYSVSQQAWDALSFEKFTHSLIVITAGSTLCLARYFFRNINPNGVSAKIICIWGKASVGVLLFEGLVRKLFFVDMVEFLGKQIPVFAAGCITAMAVCMVCALIAGIIQHTPGLKKLL